MSRYLISFDDGWMTFLREDLAAVADAAHAVVREAKAAGIWVHGGGLERQRASVVDPDGTVRDGAFPETKAVVGTAEPACPIHRAEVVRIRRDGRPAGRTSLGRSRGNLGARGARV